MATLEEFEKYFGPYSYRAIIMEERMSEVEGKIVTIKHDANMGRYGFMLSDGEWYSQFLKDGMDEDFVSTVKSLKEGDTVRFKYDTNKKGFKNYTNVEKIIQTKESFDDEPDNGHPVNQQAYTNRDKIEILRIAANCATVLSKPEKEAADPEMWSTWFSSIRSTLDTEYWKL